MYYYSSKFKLGNFGYNFERKTNTKITTFSKPNPINRRGAKKKRERNLNLIFCSYFLGVRSQITNKSCSKEGIRRDSGVGFVGK